MFSEGTEGLRHCQKSLFLSPLQLLALSDGPPTSADLHWTCILILRLNMPFFITYSVMLMPHNLSQHTSDKRKLAF